MDTTPRLTVHCETVRSNQFELLADLVRRRYDERPPVHPIAPERLRFSLGEMMRDSTIARIWIAYVGRKPAGFAIMTLGCSLASGGRHAVLDECYLIPEAANAENFGAVLATVEGAADGLRLGRVFVSQGERDQSLAEAMRIRRYSPAERSLFVRD